MDKPQETRQRLLEAACDVFAGKGYRNATVQDICERAGANIAAVNYYFGSKQSLYEEVWTHLWDVAHRGYQAEIESIDSPVERLHAIIRTRIHHLLGGGKTGRLPAIIYREMADPTELNQQLVERFLKPAIESLTATVAAILGVPKGHPAARRCAVSIQSQFMSINIMRQKKKQHPLLHMLGVSDPTAGNLNALTDHIFSFVQGGLNAVKQGLEGGEKRGMRK